MTNSSILFVMAVLAADNPGRGLQVPLVHDTRLKLTLLAREPEVVTPTALASDRQGRLYVVESHTHSRGPHYQGPDSDRILVFNDADRDGQFEAPRVFADGLRYALAIAFSGDGGLYVVQMKSVVVLRDADQDGRCDLKSTILQVETPNNNNHGVLLSLAFDPRHRLYVSLGNIGGSAYSIQGADGRVLSGRGDTGLIVRSQADGSALERFAHGFWNPCDLRFSAAGRLLATDNDPDARGPNRVLHVIYGGDYGYKSRYGNTGLHPYCAWNGELPGTLPMVAGVGEAPVGLLECRTSALPTDYADDLLVCVWGTNEVVRVRTSPRGASLVGRVEPLIRGDANFRPTGIVAAARGTCYIADWADRQYPVHGKGRIWQLSVQPDVPVLRPKLPLAEAEVDSSEARLRRLEEADTPASFDELMAAAVELDPFAASAAATSLGREVFRERVLGLLRDPDPRRRIAALIALAKAGADLDSATLRELLHDDDSQVRKLAMIRIGESRRRELDDDLRQSVSLQAQSADLFQTLLATLQLLHEEPGTSGTAPGNRLGPIVDQPWIRLLLVDDGQPAVARMMAVRFLTDVDRPESVRLLSQLSHSSDAMLASEAVRTLASASEKSVAPLLLALAGDRRQPTAVRCDAIMALAASEARDTEPLLPFIGDTDPHVALTALRALTPKTAQDSVRQALQSLLSKTASNPDAAAQFDQLRFALKLDINERPRTDEQWKKALATRGDPEAGGRVFFDRRIGCSKCHSIEGRGGRIGPDLSNIAAAKTREQIESSLLNPSLEKSPDYQGYLVRMSDGRSYRGTQFHFRGESAELLLESGEQVRFLLRDADDYHALDESLMPEKLEEAMSVSELRDLIDFLCTLSPDEIQSRRILRK
jgi:putative membrane-bound dehydrogenase-like protein